ncbi:MAG: DUF4852 domain-containing protein [Proteobacteria bacterium]|nr:DUF4852 domain-containing protein [Pseudomonadota bacterium]
MKKFYLAAITLLALLGPASATEEAGTNVKYAPVSLESLSDVLFRKGILKTDDSAAVEEYIRIHECGLYEKYISDDFAWNRIREAYARELQVSLPTLPDGLEITSAISLDQYNMGTNEFDVALKNQMDRTGIISVLESEGGSLAPCRSEDRVNFVPRVHPLSVNVKLDVPVTFKTLPMSRAEADRLVAKMKDRPYENEEDRRAVTLVMRVRLTSVDPLSSVTDPMRRTVLGLLDDFRVYDGPDKKQLLFRRDYQTQREKTQKQKQ